MAKIFIQLPSILPGPWHWHSALLQIFHILRKTPTNIEIVPITKAFEREPMLNAPFVLEKKTFYYYFIIFFKNLWLQSPLAHRPIICWKFVLGTKFSVPNFFHFCAISSALSKAGFGIGLCVEKKDSF
jgi:hypothetical protein